MFSCKDYKKCWFLYQGERLPNKMSIDEFYLKQGVPVNEFNKWYRDTHKSIHPIHISVKEYLIMEDLLLPAYQKLYEALQSLERFNKGQDLFENIACIDSFLSEFRNVTFVLQKSLAHTAYKGNYESLREAHLKNEDCSWLVSKRNEVLKEAPFNLEKSLKLILYHPNGAGVYLTESYTIEDEKDYSSLIEMIKGVIEQIPVIEVFFSVEFVYREIGSERNLFSTIDKGIDSMLALLDGLNKIIVGDVSKTRERVIKKIEDLHFHTFPKDIWFIEDYVFYRQDHIFEKGERYEMITPFKMAIPFSLFCDMFHVKNNGNFVNETFTAFIKMHILAFSKQKELAPTFLTLNKDGVLSMVMYHATIKTTTYRKIHEIAEEIKNGAPIVAVFHVCEMLCYNDMDAYKQDYSYRSKGVHTELLSFNIVTKDGATNYCVSSEAILYGKKYCTFPKLTKVDTIDTISFMNPIVNAFEG